MRFKETVDQRTQAWLDDMFIYSGGNVYGPNQLKDEIESRSEWSKRFRRDFEHVLAERTLTAIDYERRTDIYFDSDEEMFLY